MAWAGFNEVELVLEQEPFPPEGELQERLRAEDLKPAALRLGTLPVGEGEKALHELGRIGRAAALARSLDAALVVLEAPAEGDLPGLAKALELLDRALKAVEVDLCVVNRRGTLLADPEALRDLWRGPVPERLCLALDPGQALLSGWSPLDLDLLPALPRHVYLNDASRERIVPPGEGRLDLKQLGDTLQGRGFRGSLCLLLQNADPWAVEPLARELSEAAAVWFPLPG